MEPLRDISLPGADAECSEEEEVRRSIKGATTSPYQVRPRPKTKPPEEVDEPGALDFGEGEVMAELQPVDGGFGAWSYVAAAFSMFIVVWGFPQAFPIFQTHLTAGPDAPYPGSVIVRLLAPGLQDIEEGILFPILPRNPRYRPWLVILGIVIITASLMLAGRATTDWQIVLSQGVAFGAGGILLNFAHVSIFSEWFDKKQGQAMGIIWTGWRVGALAFPLICQYLLDEHGFQETLHVLIPAMLTLLAPSVLLFRGRYHAAGVSVSPATPSVSKLRALRQPSVLYYLFATTLYQLVMNVPKMFITTFAADIGLSGRDQALTLVSLTLCEMIGTSVVGWLSDSIHYGTLAGSIAAATAVIHLVGLGFARSRPSIFMYAATVGLASGGFCNCLVPFYGKLAGGNSELFTAIHSLFSLFAGAAILSVGPVGAELLKHAPTANLDEFAIARYQNLLVYASSMSLASAAMLLARSIVDR